MNTLTDFEHRTLQTLADTGWDRRLPPSAIGYMLWEQCDPATRKRNPSPQGLALFASKFLRVLAKRSYAHQHDGWYITGQGRAALKERS